MKPTHRIFLEDRRAPRVSGRGWARLLRQTGETTETYYEVNCAERLEALGRGWYRVTGTSRGRAFSALYFAVREWPREEETTQELGARMRRVAGAWYVEAAEVDLKLALDLRKGNGPLSGFQAAALVMAGAVLGLELLVLEFGLKVGSQVPDMQRLSVGSAVMMVSLVALDVVRRKVR